MAYLSQSFFPIPTLIRRQFNYVIILKLSGKRDLNLILSNYALGIEMYVFTEDVLKFGLFSFNFSCNSNFRSDIVILHKYIDIKLKNQN